MKRFTQTGSHIIALAVGVLVVGLVAFAGYTVLQRQNDTTATTATPASSTSSSDDLTGEAETLDDSSSQIDSNLDDTALDSDLNDML